MFYEDVHTQIMPWRSDNLAWSIQVLPAGPASLTAVRQALAACAEYQDHDLRDFWCDVVRSEAARLVIGGVVAHEIVRDGAGIHALPLPAGRLIRTPLGVLQLVPPATAAEVGKSWVWLPRDDVWTIDYPAALGTSSGNWWMQKRLIAFDSLPPDWVMTAWSQMAKAPFDLQQFAWESNVEMARACNRWSWPARRLFHDNLTNYEQIVRELGFRRALACLREHICAQVNKLLSTEGLSIAVSGLPTAAGIDGIVADLKAGRRTFLSTLDETKLY
jgi:hypothetical protein